MFVVVFDCMGLDWVKTFYLPQYDTRLKSVRVVVVVVVVVVYVFVGRSAMAGTMKSTREFFSAIGVKKSQWNNKHHNK